MRRFGSNRSNVDSILVDIVLDSKIADTKFPNRRLTEKWGNEIEQHFAISRPDIGLMR